MGLVVLDQRGKRSRACAHAGKIRREVLLELRHEDQPLRVRGIGGRCGHDRIDEHETGLRRILNFGHTLGHALEAVTAYKRFLHGEAVGWGMLAAAALAGARGELSSEPATRLSALIDRVGERPRVEDLSIADCVAATARDKKVVAGTLHFVLPVGIGRTRIANDVTTRELAGEQQILRRLYDEQLAGFRRAPGAAGEYAATGERPRVPGLPDVEVAATTVLVSALINHDEFVMKR